MSAGSFLWRTLNLFFPGNYHNGVYLRNTVLYHFPAEFRRFLAGHRSNTPNFPWRSRREIPRRTPVQHTELSLAFKAGDSSPDTFAKAQESFRSE
jgi:hypothetical protein